MKLLKIVFAISCMLMMFFSFSAKAQTPNCAAIKGAYIASFPASLALQGLAEGEAAKAACERGESISTLLQILESRKAQLSPRVIVQPYKPSTQKTIDCQYYGYGTGLVCTEWTR